MRITYCVGSKMNHPFFLRITRYALHLLVGQS